MSFEEPDRIPVDFGQDFHNGIHEIAYKNLINYMGIKDDIEIYDCTQRLAKVKDEILDIFHVDTGYIFSKNNKNFILKIEEDGSYKDEFGVKRKRCGYYCETIYSPLADLSRSEMIKWKLPDPEEKSRFESLGVRTKEKYKDTNYALIAGNPASLFYLATELRGYQKFMEDLIIDPQIANILVDKLLEWNIAFMDSYLNQIGKFIEVVWLGDDWGTQLGPVISPDIFRKMFKPKYKRLIDAIKNITFAKICLHSCGSVLWAINDFVDIGIDILHPLQGDAFEMNNPELIKKKFGNKIAFYSNISNQTILPNGTKKDIEKEVIKKIKYLAPGGGYIFSMGHNIQADVPAENIVTGFDTVYKYGKYPIRNL